MCEAFKTAFDHFLQKGEIAPGCSEHFPAGFFGELAILNNPVFLQKR
jgi:hypothetical protein